MSGAYSSHINAAAKRYGIAPKLVQAVAMQESTLGKASRNVMQVNGMENAAPEDTIYAGARMLASYLKQTGSLEWTLAMYNMGAGIYDWAKKNGINDPREAMEKFSAYMKKKHGYKRYGDPDYIDHVLRYLK